MEHPLEYSGGCPFYMPGFQNPRDGGFMKNMENNVEMSRIEQALYDRAAARKLPVHGVFELTPYCNLSCKMCFVKETEQNLPLQRGRQWLDIAHQAADLGALYIGLTGGEPTLHPDFREIYSGIRKLGIIVTMNTNGTRIDDNLADFLAADMPRHVNVSLYGPNEHVYRELCGNEAAFYDTIQGIERMLARKIPVRINMTISTINYPYLDEMFEICRKYGLPVEMNSYLFEPIRKCHSEKQHYRLDYKEMAAAFEKWDRYRYSDQQMIARSILAYEGLAKFARSTDVEGYTPMRCRAAKSSFWVCWDGNMSLCGSIPEPKFNVAKLGFSQAWQRIKEAGENVRVPLKCMTCSLKSYCLSCSAIGFHENGTFMRVPEIMCSTAVEYATSLASTVRKGEQRRISTE